MTTPNVSASRTAFRGPETSASHVSYSLVVSYGIDASLEGEVAFADGSSTVVFIGDKVALPIPLRLTSGTGSAAVGLAA